MRVELIAFTPQPEWVVAAAARLCYSAVGIPEITKSLTEVQVGKFVEKLMKIGHHSPFEHVSFSFGIEGISRVTSHQLVRHRIASYSQQSQRYVSYQELPCIIPSTISQEPELAEIFNKTIDNLKKLYATLLERGVPAEDARYVLPNAMETKIVVTMNARELLHFFTLRCCRRAQWEIRAMADEMLRQVKPIAPHIFAQAGPSCVSDRCQEGEMSCGKPRKELLEGRVK
ncbi:MAG: FAD-dependent thymidylate synthase [bacterium]|nr:FAD-dependent thymidylate synthase [bacterium]